jgi:N-acylneuraminate cytidylyltransferase
MIKRLLIIPARAGSKRIKNKNFKLFLNKPIILYSLDAAIKSKLFHKIHISTDSNKIIKLLKKVRNIEVDFMRPKSLSGDKTSILEVINYVHKKFKDNKFHYDEIWSISACTPLINKNDLYNVSKIIKKNKTVLAVTEYPTPIEWAATLNKRNVIKFLNNKNIKIRSQDIKKKYYDSGCLIAIPNKVLDKNYLNLNQNCVGYILPKSRSIDIDDLEDWKISEALYKKNYE